MNLVISSLFTYLDNNYLVNFIVQPYYNTFVGTFICFIYINSVMFDPAYY